MTQPHSNDPEQMPQPDYTQAQQAPSARDPGVSGHPQMMHDPHAQAAPQGSPAPGHYAAPPEAGAPHYNYSAPFSQAEATMPKGNAGGGKAALWAVLGAVGAVLVLGIGFVVYHSLQDPYRTLDTFPTEKYLNSYQSVVGSHFRANLTVDAELGGSFDMGRILTFREESTQRSLAILVPPSLAQTGFSRGQSYVAEIEVGQGGLIHAHGFKKN